MIGNIGTKELIIIAVILLVLFGGKKLNELARGLGESGKEFKKVKREFGDAVGDLNSEEIPEKKSTKKKGGAKSV